MSIIEKFVDAGGIHTKYLEAGSGKPLVLVHGLNHWSGVWKFNIAPLSKDYRVIIPDMVGHGDTDKPQDESYDSAFTVSGWPISLKRWTQDAALVGNSLGGGVSFGYVATHPNSITHLILLASGGFSKPLCIELRLLTLPIIDRFIARPSYNNSLIFWEKCLADHDRIPEELVIEHFEREKDPLGRIPFIRTIKQNIDLRGIKDQILRRTEDLAPNVKIPILIVWGEDDQVSPIPEKEDILKHFPHAQFETIPNCGHTPMIECPEIINGVIRDFVKGADRV